LPNVSPKHIVVSLLGLAALAACAPKEDEPRNGVNDVRASCTIRTTWANASRDKCVNCLASAAAPACECETFKEFAGQCYSQDQARLAEPSCTTPVKDCAHNCPKSDCGCVEACYASAEACKRATAATEGCVTDVCAPHCK
jgi:hypothetical protein